MDEESKEVLRLARQVVLELTTVLGLVIDKPSAEELVRQLHDGGKGSEELAYYKELHERAMALLGVMDAEPGRFANGMIVDMERGELRGGEDAKPDGR